MAAFIGGVVTLWFLEALVALVYVAVDIRTTPEDPVMKWGFVIITAFTGPLGAFLYVLGCREPLPGTHELYVAARWRQALGSTLHCVAGDGVGILGAAGVTSALGMAMPLELLIEYVVGFLFGWTIFQALFMKDMAGGSYLRSLTSTLLPEFLSMNGVMAGMAMVMAVGRAFLPGAGNPLSPTFWFVMSMATIAGIVVAYPINWWLVDRGLKHGMMTVRPDGAPVPLIAGLYAAGAALGGPGPKAQHHGGPAGETDADGRAHAGHEAHAGHGAHAAHPSGAADPGEDAHGAGAPDAGGGHAGHAGHADRPGTGALLLAALITLGVLALGVAGAVAVGP